MPRQQGASPHTHTHTHTHTTHAHTRCPVPCTTTHHTHHRPPLPAAAARSLRSVCIAREEEGWANMVHHLQGLGASVVVTEEYALTPDFRKLLADVRLAGPRGGGGALRRDGSTHPARALSCIVFLPFFCGHRCLRRSSASTRWAAPRAAQCCTRWGRAPRL